MQKEKDKNVVRLNDGKIHHVVKKSDGVYIDGIRISLKI